MIRRQFKIDASTSPSIDQPGVQARSNHLQQKQTLSTINSIQISKRGAGSYGKLVNVCQNLKSATAHPAGYSSNPPRRRRRTPFERSRRPACAPMVQTRAPDLAFQLIHIIMDPKLGRGPVETGRRCVKN